MKNNLPRTLLVGLLVGCLLSLAVSAAAAEIRFEKPLPQGGTAILTFDADPLLSMTHTTFSVELIGGTGKVISDAAVSLQLTMPAMEMPLNNPKAPWLDGAYRGSAVFTMAGEWEAAMFIQRPGHDQVTLNFNLGQVLMK